MRQALGVLGGVEGFDAVPSRSPMSGLTRGARPRNSFSARLRQSARLSSSDRPLPCTGRGGKVRSPASSRYSASPPAPAASQAKSSAYWSRQRAALVGVEGMEPPARGKGHRRIGADVRRDRHADGSEMAYGLRHAHAAFGAIRHPSAARRGPQGCPAIVSCVQTVMRAPGRAWRQARR